MLPCLPQPATGATGTSVFSTPSPAISPSNPDPPAPISCANPQGVLTCADYDGQLSQLHAASGHVLADVDAHEGRRIWEVVHSPLTPHLCISSSDDRTARLWAGQGLAQRAGTLRPSQRGAVCGADFSSSQSHLVALASADCGVYLYDLRAPAAPLRALRHHRRPVSYVRFFGADRLISASIDGSLACWNLADFGAELELAKAGANTPSAVGDGAVPPPSAGGNGGGSSADAGPWRVFRGHTNQRNFVGLSVRPSDRLMACGSESGAVFTYSTSWDTPLASFAVPPPATPAASAPAAAPQACDRHCVTAVAWQPAASAASSAAPLLAAGCSAGGVQLLALTTGATIA